MFDIGPPPSFLPRPVSISRICEDAVVVETTSSQGDGKDESARAVGGIAARSV